MESLLRLSGVPFTFWTTYFKQQYQKDSRAYDALAEVETSFALNVEVVGTLIGNCFGKP